LLIAGIGPGFGASLAETFAGAGYDVAGLARSDAVASDVGQRVEKQGGSYTHLTADLAEEMHLAEATMPIADHVDVLVFNAHGLLIKPFTETTPAAFEDVWRVGCLGGFHAARTVVPGMVSRGRGTIIFTGATAAVRGGAKFCAFASAKFALRGLAQSLARELGPSGIHVAHVVIDGLIDEPQTEARFGVGGGQRLDPAAIAQSYLSLAGQDRSAWTHELDLRPFSERF